MIKGCDKWTGSLIKYRKIVKLPHLHLLVTTVSNILVVISRLWVKCRMKN